VLPNTGREDAIMVAERIRVSLSGMPLNVDGQIIHFSCSIGAVIRRPGEKTSNADLMHEADMALYRSKESGRNRVTGSWSLSKAA